MTRVVRRYPLQTALWAVVLILVVVLALAGWAG